MLAALVIMMIQPLRAAKRKMPVEEAHKILGIDSAEIHNAEARDILAEVE